MQYCIIEIRTQTATFRNPEFQNFHKSLLLPPPSTLIGLAGSALGLSPKASQDYFEEDSFWMGVYGTSKGQTKDLWKYRTLSNEEGKESSIVMKEILYDNYFVFVYGSDNEVKIKAIEEAFLNPVYALSLGNNDSIAKVINTNIISQTTTSKKIEHCLVDGDIVGDVLANAAKNMEFSIYASSEPITFDLPTSFAYESDYGIRRVIARQQLSFVGKQMKLNVDKEGVVFNDKFIPIFPLKTFNYAR
jgi:CRISPR-associated protein Cas5t